MKTFAHTKMAREAERVAKTYRDAAKRIRQDRKIVNEVARVMDTRANYLKAVCRDVYQWTSPGAEPSMTISINGIDSFKNPVLVELLEKLMDIGFKLSSADYPVATNRDYYGSLTTANGLQLKCQVVVYVRDDSPTCKKVPKSSRMVEQVEYEIVCD